ncbi:MAG TPA: TIM-barrel domain-containing protein [Chloroflexota bacterium]|nr:TIM-barrel domain-containing protein [Chloroflexota bacterium]
MVDALSIDPIVARSVLVYTARMHSFLDDPSAERFVARRATGWRHQDSAVVLELEGAREPDATGVAAILAGAGLGGAVDRAELSIWVLDAGVVRLQVGSGILKDAGLLDEDEVSPAPLSVTTADKRLRITSERHGGYGPDPEDLTIEITLDPLGLTVLDAGGRPVVRLASEPPEDSAQAGVAPFAWVRWTGDDGLVQRAATVSLAVEPEERLFGLGERAGPLNLLGTTQTVAPIPDDPTVDDPVSDRLDEWRADDDVPRPRPPFLLSSRGYGLLVHTAAGLTAELAVRSPTAYTLAVEEPALDLVVFPSSWPRTAVAGYARLTGRAVVPPHHAFDLAETGDVAAPGDVEAMRDRLRKGLTYGLATPGFWRADLNPPSAASVSSALLARWAQLALLSPLVGIETSVPRDPAWSNPLARSVVQSYAALRYRLRPYLLHCARETAQTGLPMLRPMLLEFSWDPEAVEIDDQYLLGRDLLVAPVFSDAAEPVTRRVYLPAYANWYDWWTGTLHEGRQWVETTVPLGRVPLYVRAGTAIPLADPRQAGGDAPVEATRLLLFAPRDGAIGASVELNEDDLLGVEQERGDRKARIFVEGLTRTIRDLEIVGLPVGTRLVDASSPRIALAPGDGTLPGLEGAWNSVTISLDVGAFTAGLELAW